MRIAFPSSYGYVFFFFDVSDWGQFLRLVVEKGRTLSLFSFRIIVTNAIRTPRSIRVDTLFSSLFYQHFFFFTFFNIWAHNIPTHIYEAVLGILVQNDNEMVMENRKINLWFEITWVIQEKYIMLWLLLVLQFRKYRNCLPSFLCLFLHRLHFSILCCGQCSVFWIW